MADMGFDRLLQLLDEADSLSESSRRYDIGRVICLRMATLDPEATVDHMLGRSYRPSWLAFARRDVVDTLRRSPPVPTAGCGKTARPVVWEG